MVRQVVIAIIFLASLSWSPRNIFGAAALSGTDCPGIIETDGSGGFVLACSEELCDGAQVCFKQSQSVTLQDGARYEVKCTCGGQGGFPELGACCHVYVKYKLVEIAPGIFVTQFDSYGAHGSCNYWGACETFDKQCKLVPIAGFPRIWEAGCLEWSQQ